MSRPRVDHADVSLTLDGLYARTVRERMGFFDKIGLAYLAEHDRLRLVLIRWHEGRALCPAQDAARLIAAAEAGGWCVRDVSLPAGDPVYRQYGKVSA